MHGTAALPAAAAGPCAGAVRLRVVCRAGRSSLRAARPPAHAAARPRPLGAAAARAVAAATSPAPEVNRVLALDFDGVVCDSVGESAVSAWKAGEQLWPSLFLAPAAQLERPRVLAEMRAVRPVVETGYENVVQVRLLLERLVSVERMLEAWGAELPAWMERWGLQRGALVELFGGVRDAWMADDMRGWLAANALYPGVADAMRAALADARADVSVVTTKQARFTHAILSDLAGVPLPLDRIYSQTVSGRPKTEVLAALAARAPPAARLLFVEDKYSTLEKVAAAEGFEKWELYLVDWGYNTAAERAAAAAHPRIRLVSPATFADLLAGGPPPPQ